MRTGHHWRIGQIKSPRLLASADSLPTAASFLADLPVMVTGAVLVLVAFSWIGPGSKGSTYLSTTGAQRIVDPVPGGRCRCPSRLGLEPAALACSVFDGGRSGHSLSARLSHLRFTDMLRNPSMC